MLSNAGSMLALGSILFGLAGHQSTGADWMHIQYASNGSIDSLHKYTIKKYFYIYHLMAYVYI